MFCESNVLDIHMMCLTENPFAVIIRKDMSKYHELIEKLSYNPIGPYFYIFGSNDEYNVGNVILISESTDETEIVSSILIKGNERLRTEASDENAFRERVSYEVSECLEKLYFQNSYKGTRYLKCILTAICMGELKYYDNLSSKLYTYPAEQFNVSVGSVERCIRTAIESSWEKIPKQTIRYYFGCSIASENERPTNKCFITSLADRLMQNMKQKGNIQSAASNTFLTI